MANVLFCLLTALIFRYESVADNNAIKVDIQDIQAFIDSKLDSEGSEVDSKSTAYEKQYQYDIHPNQDTAKHLLRSGNVLSASDINKNVEDKEFKFSGYDNYTHLKVRSTILFSVLEPINDFVLLPKDDKGDKGDHPYKKLDEIFSNFTGLKDRESLESLKTNFLGFNLTDLNEAKLFLDFVPGNFSVSGAHAIFYKNKYYSNVTPSSGLKAKTMDFFRKMTQKRYRELSDVQIINLNILKYGQRYEESTLTYKSKKFVKAGEYDDENAILKHLKKKGFEADADMVITAIPVTYKPLTTTAENNSEDGTPSDEVKDNNKAVVNQPPSMGQPPSMNNNNQVADNQVAVVNQVDKKDASDTGDDNNNDDEVKDNSDSDTGVVGQADNKNAFD